MSNTYTFISWNPEKKRYDRAMLILMALYLLVFILTNVFVFSEFTPETLIIRATGSLALIMLHVILLIGPLSRFNTRFLPVLYNRRHLGVTMFIIAAIHGIFSLIQFHGNGDINPLVSLFTINPAYTSLSQFPFQTLGFFALLILFLMAATSHDFWLAKLGAKTWKTLHMMVYLAYGLILMHVLLGVVQLEKSPLPVILMGLGFVAIAGAHLIAGFQQLKKDRPLTDDKNADWMPICKPEEISEDRAKMVVIQGKSIAIFKYGNKISALANECKHQGGPLSEGKIIDGCITCPWHGYQYQPEDGCSPPPFTEKVATYRTKVENNIIYLDPNPLPEGTPVNPAIIS